MTAAVPAPGHEIREAERVANATVQGFFSQFLVSAIRWVHLPAGSVMVLEGNEDLDVCAMSNGRIALATEISVKNLAGRLSARSEPITDTFANFINGYAHHHRSGTGCAFVFTTTATRAPTTTNRRASRARLRCSRAVGHLAGRWRGSEEFN
jgi:hypothetical protein